MVCKLKSLPDSMKNQVYLTDVIKPLIHVIVIDSAFINFVNSRFSNLPRKFQVLS